MGSAPFDGLLVQLCLRGPEGKARYIDVGESEEHCSRAFAERIHPAVDQAFGGARPAREPEVHPMDVIEVRGGFPVGVLS